MALRKPTVLEPTDDASLAHLRNAVHADFQPAGQRCARAYFDHDLSWLDRQPPEA